MFAALRNTAFRRLAALYSLNALLEWTASIALLVVTYLETESALIVAAMLLCKHVLPGLLTPRAGRWAEQVGTRRSLATFFGFHAVAFVAVATSGFGMVIFPVAVISGVCAGVARAVIRTEVGRTLQGERLRQGNAVINVSMGVIGPVAPAVGALLAAVTSASFVLYVVAAGFGVLALWSTRVTSTHATAVVEEGLEDAAPIRRPVGIPVGWLVLLGGAVACIYSIDEPSLLAFSEISLGAGVGGYGAICTLWAIGITAGSLLFGRLLSWPMLRIYAVATVLFSAGLLGMGSAPNIEFACAAALIAGVGAGMDWVAITTAVQESAPAGREAHWVTRLEAFATAGPGIGLLLGGVIAELGGPRAGVLVPGVLSLAVLLVGVVAFRLHGARERGVVAPPHPLAQAIPGGSR